MVNMSVGLLMWCFICKLHTWRFNVFSYGLSRTCFWLLVFFFCCCFRQRPSPEKRRFGALFSWHIAFSNRDVGVPNGPPAAHVERGVQHGAETQSQHWSELPLHAAAALVWETTSGRQTSAASQTPATAAVGQLDVGPVGHVQLP